MRSGDGGIDHVVLAVHDLDEARAGWSRLGFTVTPRGRHVGQGTANYCCMFESGYLELLGLVEADAHAARLETFLRQREGAMTVAFAPSGDLEAARRALYALGLQPGEARVLGRQLESAEGDVTLRFSLVELPPEATPGLDCFICGHLTPELVRRPGWLQHLNGVVGLKAVQILVADTTPLLPAYDRLFGLHEVTTTDALASLQVGPHRVIFLPPDDFEILHPGIRIDPDFPLPGIAAIELLVNNRRATADYLTMSQIPFTEMPDGGLAIRSVEANGTVLFLTEA